MTSLAVAPKSPRQRRRDIPQLRGFLDRRFDSLKSERQTGGWDSIGMDIAGYLFPGGGRFFAEQRNRADANTQELILNCMASQALDILAAGLMSSSSSPARPWFKLAMEDPELNKNHEVQLWLEVAAEGIRTMLQRCGIYRAMGGLYHEIPAFGTGCMILLPHPRDPGKAIHPYPVTAGEYSLAANFEGEVDTMYREFQMAVGAMVPRFGLERVSQTVKNLWSKGQYESGVLIRHAIEPRPDRDATDPDAPNLRDSSKVDALNHPWRSVYWEAGSTKDVVLSESGYRRFPVVAPRWAVLGCDVYGRGPGRQCLPDIKTLQQKELRLAMGIDYQTQPPMGAPASLEGREVNLLPGGVTWYDSVGTQNRIAPLFQAEHLALEDMHRSIAKTEELINRSFHVDVFRMLAERTKELTVVEVLALQEEKMQLLSPMVERQQDELHEPLIEICFENMMAANLLPPPPRVLLEREVQYRIEFVSVMAQAAKAIGTNSTDRMMAATMQVAEIAPEVVDNLDADAWFEHKMLGLGVDPKLRRRPEARDQLRQQRAKAQAAQAQAEVLAVQAKAAKDLAAAPTQGPANALTDANQVMQGLTGYGSPVPA